MERAVSGLVIGERTTPASYSAGYILQSDGELLLLPDSVGVISAATMLTVSAKFDNIYATVAGNTHYLRIDNGHLQVPEITAPGTPGGGFYAIYAKTDGNLYGKNDAGTEAAITPISGTWTPTLAYATPGTSSWAFSVQVGDYRFIGADLCVCWFRVTGVPTNGTGAGNLTVGGFPFTTTSTANLTMNVASMMGGYAKAGFTWVAVSMSLGATTAVCNSSGTGQAITNLAVADIPTGGTVQIRGAIVYETA
jgi:hypothetical protein